MNSNLEVEIYMNRFIKFFKENPNELFNLIGDCDEQVFFEMVTIQCQSNIENGEDVIPTQQQLIDIVVKLFSNTKSLQIKTINLTKVLEETKFGLICLN